MIRSSVAATALLVMATGCGGGPSKEERAQAAEAAACAAFSKLDSDSFRTAITVPEALLDGQAFDMSTELTAAVNEALLESPDLEAPPIFNDLRQLVTTNPLVSDGGEPPFWYYDTNWIAAFERIRLVCVSEHGVTFKAVDFNFYIEMGDLFG